MVATGGAPLTFQWQFNGTNLSGGTTSAYTRANVQISDAGNYTVIVTNSAGTVTSAPAALTVSTPPLPPPLVYEPFDFTNIGGPVSANTPANWISSGAGSDDFNVTAGNLSYAGLRGSIGNSATNGGAGLGIRRLFGQTLNSGTVYFSVLFNLVSYAGWSGSSVTGGSQVCALTSSDSTTFRLQVLVRSNTPSTYLLGIQKSGATSSSTFTTTPLNLGSTVFLVGKYDFTQSPNPITLWINPNSSAFGQTEPSSGAITIATGPDTNSAGSIYGIDRFNFRQNVLTGASSVPGFMQWDELRVGTNWVTVTPARALPHFDPARFLLTSNFQWQATGDPGTIAVEVSTNLADWIEITNLTSPTGIFDFSDAKTNQSRRFYRLKLSP